MKTSDVKQMVLDKNLINDYSKVFKINKGWSKDEKFYIEGKEEKKYLLRISSVKYLNIKKKEYKIMKDVYELGMNMSAPIGFGKCNNGKNVYVLLSWVDGTALDEEITTISEEKQYNLGIKAGRILKKFHSISAPDGQEDWEQRMLKKFDFHLEKYKKCGIKVANDNKSID